MAPSIKDLVAKFAPSYVLPVEIPHVKDALKQLGVTDEIHEFIGDPNLDGTKIAGYFIRRFKTLQDGTIAYRSDIHVLSRKTLFGKGLFIARK